MKPRGFRDMIFDLDTGTYSRAPRRPGLRRQTDEERAAERYQRDQEHRGRSLGFGGTVEGFSIVCKYTARLADAVTRELAAPSKRGWERTSKASLRRLDAFDIAGTTLWALIGAIVNRRDEDSDPAAIKIRVGNAIRTEFDFDRLDWKRPGTYAAIQREMAEESSLEGKRRVAAYLADEAGFQWSTSTRELDLRAGTWLWAICLTALPDVFYEEIHIYERLTPKGRLVPIRVRVPEILPGAEHIALAIAERHKRAHPVFSPSPKAPRDWAGYRNGGYWTARSKYAENFVRNVHHAEDVAMFKRAMEPGGSMRPHMAGVSALQRVPLAINARILDVLGDIERLGLPKIKRQSKDIRTRKRQEKNTHTRVKMAALEAIPLGRFYTAKTCDRRGRVYNTTHFSFDREDHVRALFVFAERRPLDAEGLYWLKIHLANCGDFGKISKRPFDERVRWVDEHLDEIRACAERPLECLWWKEHDGEKADQPLQLLAACFELADALDAIEKGLPFETRLPVAFDGSCSGIQHLSLMGRDAETARLVNLVPSDTPQDVYQAVADRVKARLQAANDPRASKCLEWDIDRGLLKPCVMTFPYSVSSSGMRKQLNEKIRERGMKPDRDAVQYLIECLKDAIRDMAPGAVEVQKFLRQIAGVLAKVGLLARWMSPTGFPCVNHAQKTLVKVVEVKQAGLRWQHRFAKGYEAGISEAIARNRISPNVTHSMDASHLIRVANRCVAEGITDFAMIHDSFCCHASNAPAFRKIVLEELAGMYRSHNVLAAIRTRAERDIASNRKTAAIFNKKRRNKKGKELPPLKLPDAPVPKVPLDLGPILNAETEYAFG